MGSAERTTARVAASVVCLASLHHCRAGKARLQNRKGDCLAFGYAQVSTAVSVMLENLMAPGISKAMFEDLLNGRVALRS